MFRGNDFSEWDGQTHPLLIVVSTTLPWKAPDLENVHAAYDPSQGNILSFGINGSRGTEGNPRDDFFAWTSQFAKDKIFGTPNETYLARRRLENGRDSKRIDHQLAHT